MKKCSKSKKEKEVSKFYKSKRQKDGLYPSCKDCEVSRSLDYYNKNKEEQLERKKERYYNNHEFNLKKMRDYNELNRELVNKKSIERYYDNLEYARNYYKNNREVILERNRKWIEKNKEYFKKLNVENSKRWLKKNPHVVVWRQILYRTINRFGIKKENKTIELLGYSAIELKNHIELLFEDGMTWENWGEWHIDHTHPLSLFDKETPINEVNSLSNLKPMWASDNLKKGNRI